MQFLVLTLTAWVLVPLWLATYRLCQPQAYGNMKIDK